jgi:tRNA (cytidine32/uridine32-2'-O)-methyltransferase
MNPESLQKLSEKIRIVMVETTHPGNIGAAARAMKTMGQDHLFLVNPKVFPSAEVTARAAGADDLLANARVCSTFTEAVKDCVLVIATTARDRRISWPVCDPDEGVKQLAAAAQTGDVALVFGRESSGLNNEELELCNLVMRIPTNPDFNSLNVAAAIQIICYEIMRFCKTGTASEPDNGPALATSGQMGKFYDHLEVCSINIGFIDPEKPRYSMRRMKRLFNRARLDQDEVNMLRGFLVACEEATAKISEK